MSELPQGWELVQLGYVGTWGSGGTPKRTNEGYYAAKGIPWLVIGDLTDGLVVKSANSLTELGLQNSSAKLLPIGTLLVAMYGSIGKLGITGIECATNQAIAFCRPNEAVVSLRYLYHALFDAKPRLLALGQGGAQQNISQSVLKDFQIALAPKNEQTRIANQLDTLLTRIQACNDRFDAIPTLLKRFRQMVLDTAVSGALTCSWRVDRDAADWSATTVSSICEQRRVITYGVVKLGEVVPNGTPCLRTSNVRWLRFELDGMKRIAPSLSAEYSRTILRGGEVLVNVRGTLGGVAVAGNEMVGWNISREVAVLPIDQSIVNPHFAAYWVASDASQKWLAGMEKGIAYVGINIEDLRNLPIRLPSLLEQAEIVRRVEARFALADRIEARCTAARDQHQRLAPLVLAKAFRGELVPQDPTDEPASALLTRIASSNTAVAGKNKRKVPVALMERAQAAINS